MKIRRAMSLGLMALLIGAAAASSVTAQTAPPEGTGRWHELPPPEEADPKDGVTPNRHGDDAVACRQAERALAAPAGEKREEALRRAKDAAATPTMRAVIDSGVLPKCPPPGPASPEEAQPNTQGEGGPA